MRPGRCATHLEWAPVTFTLDRSNTAVAYDHDSHSAAVALFMGVLDIPRDEATAFVDAGHTSLEELAFVPLEELMEVRLNRLRVLEVRERARRCMIPGAST